jgi:hypothetical protein
MINSTKEREFALRVLGGVSSLSFLAFLCFFFGLPLFLSFVGFVVFSSSR